MNNNIILQDTKSLPNYCCILVLYNPAANIELKIKQYAAIFPFLCVVDNSPKSIISDSFRSSFPKEKVLFVHNANIGGIAKALNIGASEAIKQNFTWMLALDQDSELTSDMLNLMRETWQRYNFDCMRRNREDKIGMIAPYLLLQTDSLPEDVPDCEFPLTVMTSGTILNLRAYQRIGSFNESLVIDYVDHEYCLRLRIGGYKILKANRAVLKHKLGHGISHNLLGRRLLSTNHTPLRRYYITRNRLYTAFRYRDYFPKFFWHEIRLTCTDLIIIVLYEDNKWQKIKKTLKGIMDFCKGNMGYYDNNHLNDI